MFHQDGHTTGDATYFDFYKTNDPNPWPTNPKKPLKKDLSTWIKLLTRR